jgi:hypothetical protein
MRTFKCNSQPAVRYITCLLGITITVCTAEALPTAIALAHVGNVHA